MISESLDDVPSLSSSWSDCCWGALVDNSAREEDECMKRDDDDDDVDGPDAMMMCRGEAPLMWGKFWERSWVDDEM